MIKEKFRIPQIHCSSCAMLIEGIEDELDGIKSAHVDVRTKTVVVNHDENISSDQIVAAIELASGYRAEPDGY